MAHHQSPDPWTAFTREPSEEAFRPIYEATKRLVWTVCARVLRDPADAGDAFQSAYCRLLALARDPAGAAAVSDVVATACRLARLEADSLRKRRARRGAREGAPGVEEAMDRQLETVEAAALRREVRERVEALVADLPAPLRLPVELHFFHGLSQRDVARATGEPLSTVSDRIRAALRRLDSSFRRAGLRDAAATLAGIAVAGGLLDPPLAAAEVFARAQLAATLTAATAAGAGGSTVTLPGLAALAIAIMKTKTAVVLAVTALAVSSVLLLATREPAPPRDPGALAGAPAADRVVEPPRPPATLDEARPAEGAGSELVVAVLWEGTGEPVLDAEVTAAIGGEGQAPHASGRTGAAGRAALTLPPAAGAVRIQVLHPEAAPAEFTASLPAAEPVTVRLTLDVIAGAVTDALTGKPLAGAVVRSGERRAVAAGDGAYVLAGLGKGVHGITASADGHADLPAQVSHSPPARSLQDFALDPAAAAVVTVVGEGGEPLAGARVVAAKHGTTGIFHLDEGRDTDERGVARLEGLSRIAPPVIQAAKAGYRSASLAPPSRSAGDLELRLALARSLEEGRVITGRVADGTGRPIAGAVIEWKDGWSTQFGTGAVYGQFRAVTDRTGAYRLEFTDAHDTCHLGVAAKGWAPAVALGVKSGAAEAPAVRDFTLEPGHWLKGRVADESSRPLAGVKVEVMPHLGLLNEGVAYPAVHRQAETDAEGRFALEDLPGPKAGIRLRGRDRRPSLEQEVEVDREVELVLKGYGVIRGRVADAESGEPVLFFRVRLLGNAIGSERFLPGETFTSEEGIFILRDLDRNARYGVIVEADGFLRATVRDLEPADDGTPGEVEVSLTAGRALEGIVIDAATGSALTAVEVVAGDPDRVEQVLEMGEWDAWRLVLLDLTSTVTGDAGRFLLHEGEPGALLFRAPGRRKLVLKAADRVEWTGPDGALRIPLARGERLRGVYRERGRPVAGVDVRVQPVGEAAGAGEAVRAIGTTDSEGSFGCEDLAPGPHVLEVTRKTADPAPQAEVRIRWQVEVKPMEENRAEIGDDPGAITLRGRLAGMEGRESVWATLTLKPLPGAAPDPAAPEFSLTTYKEWGWKFSCPFLRPGKYTATLSWYAAGATRSATLSPLELTRDEEREIATPAER